MTDKRIQDFPVVSRQYTSDDNPVTSPVVLENRVKANPDSVLLIRQASDPDFYVHGENIINGSFTRIPFTTLVNNTAGVVMPGNAKTGTYTYSGGGSIATLNVTDHGFVASDVGSQIPVHFLDGPAYAADQGVGTLQMQAYVNANSIRVIGPTLGGGSSGNVSLEWHSVTVPDGYTKLRCRGQVLWMYDWSATNPNICPDWVSMGMLMNNFEEVIGFPGMDLTALGPPEWMTYHNTGDSSWISVTPGDAISMVALIGVTYGNSCYVDGTPSTYFEIEFA